MTNTTMTQEKILALALAAAIQVWYEHKKRADEFPGNKIAAYKEQQKWKEVQELEKMLKEITEAK